MSPRVIRHDGPCGDRETCWRAECRERFPYTATIEKLPDGEVLAYCHRGRFTPIAFRIDACAVTS